MKEHELMLDFSERLVAIAGALTGARDQWIASPHKEEIGHLVDHLVESESHYVREENVLFPIIEKHGISGPTRMMWMEHDDIRKLKKELSSIIDNSDSAPFDAVCAPALRDGLGARRPPGFPFQQGKLDPLSRGASGRTRARMGGHTAAVRRAGLLLLYPRSPAAPDTAHAGAAPSAGSRIDGTVILRNGDVSRSPSSPALLDRLPVDVTFVDKDDTVRYFNQAADRIFPRAKAVIGRTVQNCHPQKSLDKVQAILDGFRSGTLDKADFWIPMGEKLVLIRYFAVRDGAGDYLGCLEVTQDIAPIKAIEGEKRLL